MRVQQRRCSCANIESTAQLTDLMITSRRMRLGRLGVWPLDEAGSPVVEAEGIEEEDKVNDRQIQCSAPFMANMRLAYVTYQDVSQN